jgi:protein-disulfide isomerase
MANALVFINRRYRKTGFSVAKTSAVKSSYPLPSNCVYNNNELMHDKLSIMKPLLLVAFALASALPATAQIAMPATRATTFKDTSILKPPAGAKVAIIEFEDLECPLCAEVSPLVHAAMAHYNIPRVHHDFIITGHVWSRTGAIYARYLEDKVSPQIAEDFRRDVFASQSLIAGPDDLQRFTRKWFQTHNQQMPFVIDPSGHCAAEVQADCNLALRLGAAHTPTIVVVTAHQWIEVTNPNQLYAAIDRAEAEVNSPAKRTQPSTHK